MTDPKLSELVRYLYIGVRNNKIRWERTADDDIFLTSFAGYTIRIVRYDGELMDEGFRADAYRIEIFDAFDTRVHTIVPEDVDSFRIKGEENTYTPYGVFSDIYYTARRQALGVDKAIDTLIHELRNVAKPSIASVFDDEDEDFDVIPF